MCNEQQSLIHWVWPTVPITMESEVWKGCPSLKMSIQSWWSLGHTQMIYPGNSATCFIGWFTNHHFSCKSLSPSKKEQRLSYGGWLPDRIHPRKPTHDNGKTTISRLSYKTWWLSTTILVRLVVSTPLKNISQHGNLPQIGVKIKNIWNHHLVVYWRLYFPASIPSIFHPCEWHAASVAQEAQLVAFAQCLAHLSACCPMLGGTRSLPLKWFPKHGRIWKYFEDMNLNITKPKNI